MADREKQSAAYNHDDDPQVRDASESDYDEFERQLRLPAHGGRIALAVGVISGVVSGFLPVIIAFLAYNLHAEAGQLQDKMPYNLAQTLFLLTCLGLLLNAAVAFGAGYITGRIAIRRTLGFYAGALVGALTYIINTVANWLPGYPTRLDNGTTPMPVQTPGGVLVGSLILLGFLVVYALIAGLMGRFGAAAATNKHPYYEIGRVE